MRFFPRLSFLNSWLAVLVVMMMAIPVFAEETAAKKAEVLYGQARKVYYGLINVKDRQVTRDEWILCAGKFNGVESAFPKSREGYKAVYTVARIYHHLYSEFGRSEDLDFALQYYQKLIDDFPFKYLADDALYHKGEAYLERKNYASASDVFKTILDKYSDGDQTEKAKKALDGIKPLLSKPTVAQTDIRVVSDLSKKATVERKAEVAQKIKPVSVPAHQVLPPVPLVVLDPGHGGKDIGAQGVHGLLEKSVNLDVAKRVKDVLEKRYKYRVLLTREDDTFISLKERGALANEHSASMFVSIHTNAAPRKTAQGIETYYLGIGSNERARETAARENGELVKSVQDDQVQNILADLLGTTKINDSSRLAGRVQGHLVSVTRKYDGVKNLGVKEGPFFVLHDTNMPSILIEVGFITNSEEERRLDSQRYLNLLAFSIARGIHEFLQEREPLI